MVWGYIFTQGSNRTHKWIIFLIAYLCQTVGGTLPIFMYCWSSWLNSGQCFIGIHALLEHWHVTMLPWWKLGGSLGGLAWWKQPPFLQVSFHIPILCSFFSHTTSQLAPPYEHTSSSFPVNIYCISVRFSCKGMLIIYRCSIFLELFSLAWLLYIHTFLVQFLEQRS